MESAEAAAAAEAEAEAAAAAGGAPQPEPDPEDGAFWCVGSCKAATDLPWKCANAKCDQHGKQLVPARVVYRCPRCKGPEQRAPGTCTACDGGVRLDALAVRRRSEVDRAREAAAAPGDAAARPPVSELETDEWRPVLDTSQLPATVTATCIPGGQPSPVPVNDGPIPRIPARPSHCMWAGRKSVWEADLNGTGSHVLCVPPGAACTIDLSFQASWSRNSQDYCPGCVVQVRKRVLLRHFILKAIILPRQARDKHRENTQKETRFLYSSTTG
jgi:hypothetical protein